jgi:hypothetical protein
MGMRRDFSSLRCFGDTPAEREETCRSLAAEVSRFAMETNGEMREMYFDLASQWTKLADDIASDVNAPAINLKSPTSGRWPQTPVGGQWITKSWWSNGRP